MKKIKTLFLLITYFSINLSYSQLRDTYEKVSVDLNNGEKITGYIKADELSKMTLSICFKSSITDKNYVNYDTSQVKSFTIDENSIFELVKVNINPDSEEREEISLFANLIVKGKASLYKSAYKADNIYIIANNDKYYVLQDDKFNSGDTEIKKNYYRGMLNAATEGFTNAGENITFGEKSFSKVLINYNNSKNSESKTFAYKTKPIGFFIVHIGSGLNNNDEKEFFFQSAYRIYFPKISRSASLNIGFSHYNYQYPSTTYVNKINYTTTLTSIPIQIQENFLNKSIRPYIFAGLNLSYLSTTDNRGNSLLDDGLQSNFGFGILFGIGIEADIYKGFTIKSEYRNELFSHLLLFGVGYNFSK
jgi:Outer membrane protein beta-barrel domain